MSILADAGLSADDFDFDEAVVEDENIDVEESPAEDPEGVSEASDGEAEEASEDTPSLADTLQKFGMSPDVLPEDLPEDLADLISKIVEHGNKRVSGVMSGSTKAVQEAAEWRNKAQFYDRLANDPDFQDWYEAKRSGTLPKKSSSPWDDLDPEKLPKDPFERFRYLSNIAAKEATSGELEQLRREVNLLKNVTAASAWEKFLAQNEDLKDHEEEMKDLIVKGIAPSEAADVVRNRHFDVDAAVAAKMADNSKKVSQKRKAGGTVTKTRTRAAKKLSQEELDKMDRSTHLRYLMEQAIEETGYQF